MGSLMNNKDNLMTLISEGNLDPIRESICRGLSPSKCTKITSSYVRSPLCCAMGKGKLKIAHFFYDIGFLTPSDLADKKRVETLRKRLKNKHQKKAEFLEEFCFQPMSLKALCLIAVRSRVGTDRDNLDDLPIPKIVEDTISFKNIDKQATYLDDDVGSLDTSRDSDSEYDIRDWAYYFSSFDVES